MCLVIVIIEKNLSQLKYRKNRIFLKLNEVSFNITRVQFGFAMKLDKKSVILKIFEVNLNNIHNMQLTKDKKLLSKRKNNKFDI